MSWKFAAAIGRMRRLLGKRIAAEPRLPTTLAAGPRFASLRDYVATIDAFNVERHDMDPIRLFNHEMVDTIAKVRPLADLRVLDVGASPHGYGLERVLQLGASVYMGIGLAVARPVEVREGNRLGFLINLNGEEMALANATFDAVLSLSTFEHFQDGAQVLREMHRVLRPGGVALFHFEPVWTSSYGHHLHHYPSIGRLIPPWAHLLWNEDAMRSALAPQWPSDAPISLEETVAWVYRGRDINRIDVSALRTMFDESELALEWATPLMDDETADKPILAEYLAHLLPYSATELMTRGFAILMRKSPQRDRRGL